MKLDNKRCDLLHSLMLGWGRWILDGRSVPGLFNTSQWPEGRPVEARRGRQKRKPLLPPHQPIETRTASPGRVVMVRFERELERIHPVVLTLDDEVKNIVVCLYLRGMCFSDITRVLNIPSRKIGDGKYTVLQAIDPVVR